MGLIVAPTFLFNWTRLLQIIIIIISITAIAADTFEDSQIIQLNVICRLDLSDIPVVVAVVVIVVVLLVGLATRTTSFVLALFSSWQFVILPLEGQRLASNSIKVSPCWLSKVLI